MAALSPADIAMPIRTIFSRQKNVEVMLADVTGVNLAARRVETSHGPVEYHFLVLAAGAKNNYFGHDEWGRGATGLKGLDDAIEMRRRVLLALEVAEQETDSARRRSLLTFCIIGGGPTGVELAGALSELSRTTVRRDFKHIRPEEITVILVEGSNALLRAFDPKLQRWAAARLSRLGVDVRCGARVLGIDESGITIQEGDVQSHVPAATVLWSAGVCGTELARSLGCPLDVAGRVVVDGTLNLPGYDDVFAIGDMAACTDGRGTKVPGIAPAAMQQGRYVARQITRRLQGYTTTEHFRYFDKGNLATIGRNIAVAQFGRVTLSGFFAWVLWLFVHICFLVGYRNRYAVLLQWVWNYFTFRGGAQLITGSTNRAVELVKPRARAKPTSSMPARVVGG
jgi:NADH dehydrogenase